MLEEGSSFAEVADWLTQTGVKPGPYSRTGQWSHSLVCETTFNPILKGDRVRNRKKSERVHGTGRPRSVNAPPEELLVRHVPHLVFIEPERYDRVIDKLTRRNAAFRRKGTDGVDPRKGVPKKRTPFPGQHLTCGVCGRIYYFGGHGKTTHMMCSGSQQYRCWNGVTFDATLATARISSAVMAEIMTLPDFDSVFVRALNDEVAILTAEDDRVARELDNQELTLNQQIDRVTEAIVTMGGGSALLDKLRSLEAERDELKARRQELNTVPRSAIELPSLDQIRTLATRAFEELVQGSQEAGRLMRRLLPRLEVLPYQLCDGGNPVLRAHLTLDLAPLLPDARP